VAGGAPPDHSIGLTAKPRRLRLDRLLVERGLGASEDEARRLLLAGAVRVGSGDGARRDRKPGDLVSADASIALVERQAFVSRGGDKLAAALDAFAIDPAGQTCLDVGASTGGFTDCLLQRGAQRVYALDVGHGQLAGVLRADPRVVVLERTHAARLEPGAPGAVSLPERVSLAVIDVSFIALRRVLPGVLAQLAPDGQIVALVKPQFELPPAYVPGGVVRQPAAHRRAVAGVRRDAAGLGLEVLGETESPLTGPAGNREFFLRLRRGEGTLDRR
jgi:23S rRNA (cytidine1920-2'-O)/16S rRNA (cytidine1409-2'-O)-methyltransferase